MKSISIIAVNSSWMLVPECDYIYAGDAEWWDANIQHLPVAAERWSCNKEAAVKHSLNWFDVGPKCIFNSGQRAIEFAAYLGFSRIILLGFDCSVQRGVHWHGPHEGLKNPDKGKTERWHGEFQKTASILSKKVSIINCSAYTELDCFEVAPLNLILQDC